MKAFHIIDADGRIKETVSELNKNDAQRLLKEGEMLLDADAEGAVSSGYYYDRSDGMFKELGNPPEITTSVTDNSSHYTIRLENIPHNTKVYWPDSEITVELDGELEADVTLPGEYLFVLDNPRQETLKVFVDVEA